ncbi:MAG: PmoA family protein, partial [Planctomycetes bacterium]|nr:PmoA family protein [Planctomycetota bacterium]
LLALAACAAMPEAPSEFEWERVEGSSLALRRAGETVWRFHFGDDRGKPYFHPLALPGGRELTLDQPADHRWHHGLWFSWKFIDGVNYWEHDGNTGRPAGRTSWRPTEVTTHADGSARIVLDLDYAPPDGTPVISERRVLETTAPAADGMFAIDWDCTFTAQRDCRLDRTPLPGEPGGKVFGGYAGLSLRLVQLEDRDAVTDAGPVEWNAQHRHRGQARAFDYRGRLQDQEVGIAILDHADNPRTPSPWYAIRSPQMSFFTPAVLCNGPHAMAAGERLRLRYRVIVHPHRWSAVRLDAALAAYATPNPR